MLPRRYWNINAPPGLLIIGLFAILIGGLLMTRTTANQPIPAVTPDHAAITLTTPALVTKYALVDGQALTCVATPTCATITATTPAPAVTQAFDRPAWLLAVGLSILALTTIHTEHGLFLNRATRRLLAKLRSSTLTIYGWCLTAAKMSTTTLSRLLSYLPRIVPTSWTKGQYPESRFIKQVLSTLALGSALVWVSFNDTGLYVMAAVTLTTITVIYLVWAQGRARLVGVSAHRPFIPAEVAGGGGLVSTTTANRHVSKDTRVRGRVASWLTNTHPSGRVADTSNPLNALPAPQDPTSETANMKINTINVSPATHSVFHARGSIVENMVTRRVNEIGNCENWQLSTVNLTHTATMFDHSVLPQYRRPAHLICLTNRICRLHDIEIARGYLVSGTWKPAVAITSRPLDRPTWDAARLTTRELVTA